MRFFVPGLLMSMRAFAAFMNMNLCVPCVTVCGSHSGSCEEHNSHNSYTLVRNTFPSFLVLLHTTTVEEIPIDRIFHSYQTSDDSVDS